MNSIKILLATAVVFLGMIALHPLLAPQPVHAQAGDDYPLYFEPGVYMLRAPDNTQQVYGKVAVDMRTGKIWGFPTLQQGSPYPIDVTTTNPPTSHAMYLGKFALGDTQK
jgi:hypothetical protein